nr:PREDICTED: uncharacterized protein C2orf54 homolog [Opisthocomus hoazin]
MAASASHWRSYLEVLVSRKRQRLEHFQQAEDILLTLLEVVHATEPRFLVDYARNLEAFEFALCASEDVVTMEVPLRIDGDALRVLVCQPEDTPAGHHPGLGTCYLEVPSPGTDLEDWTSTMGVMEQGGGAAYLVPGKILQHLKELLVLAIVRCQHRFLLQPGDLTAEYLQEDAMELSLLIRSGWGRPRPALSSKRSREQPRRLKGRQSDRGFPQGSLRKATEEAHFVPASPLCWRSSTHLPVLKLLQAVDMLKGLHLDSLLLLDQLRSQDWGEEAGKGGLTFNHLKLRFHCGLPVRADGWQADPSTQALLQLPAEDGSYWDTAYFDVLLSQFQVYQIQDGVRRSAMSQLLSKIRREIPQQS